MFLKFNFWHFLSCALAVVLLIAACDEAVENSGTESEAVDSIPLSKTDTTFMHTPAIIYDYDTTLWTDIKHLDTSIILDLKYATSDNFVKEQLYDCPRCLLRPAVARAVLAAHQLLREKGLGLKMYDCYRPRPVQQKLWAIMPNASYVTPPERGSMHNRGAAVDLTIVDEHGNELDMGTAFDYFGREAHHTYTGHSDEILNNRKLLLETMEAVGMKHIRTEWWHYSFAAGGYGLSDMLWKCDGLILSEGRNKGHE